MIDAWWDQGVDHSHGHFNWINLNLIFKKWYISRGPSRDVWPKNSILLSRVSKLSFVRSSAPSSGIVENSHKLETQLSSSLRRPTQIFSFYRVTSAAIPGQSAFTLARLQVNSTRHRIWLTKAREGSTTQGMQRRFAGTFQKSVCSEMASELRYALDCGNCEAKKSERKTVSCRREWERSSLSIVSEEEGRYPACNKYRHFVGKAPLTWSHRGRLDHRRGARS